MFELVKTGKIRKLYKFDEDNYLLQTGNGISAFDVVLPDEIPRKGYILAEISNFWMEKMSDEIKNHLTNIAVPGWKVPEDGGHFQVIRKLKPLPIEAIVRGYIIGSGWKDYQKTGKISGIQLPKGLQLAEKLPNPIYTPSTKAPVGEHDENITFKDTINLVGYELAHHVYDRALTIYKKAAAFALERGVIIADTKFEFGVDSSGEIHLIDEVLTPDSSRFWDVNEYKVGISPPSFDKQIVRDYLETLDWDKNPPGPNLPSEIIDKTAQRYQDVFKRLTS